MPRRCTETHKATTYPRSDSGYLPASMLAEVPTVLDSTGRHRPQPAAADRAQLDRNQRSRAWNDGKVSAHHGIIPTLEPANLSAMNEKELAVLPADPRPLLRSSSRTMSLDRDGGAVLVRQSVAGGGGQADRRHRLAPGAGDAGAGRCRWRGCAAQPGAARPACGPVLPGRKGGSQGAEDAAAQDPTRRAS